MARPRLTCDVVKVHLHLRLRRGEDDDLLRFFEQLVPGQRSTALKMALRAGGLSEHLGTEDQTEPEFTAALNDFVF